MFVPNFWLNHIIVQDFNLNLCPSKGVPALTEEELTNLSPTAAAVAKIVKPGMKLMEVSFSFCDTLFSISMIILAICNVYLKITFLYLLSAV